jgi:phosphoribosylanthranilate isomerase
MFIKACGIKTIEEAEWAVELGYDAIGLMRFQHSHRFVEEKTARSIMKSVKGRILTVAVSLKFAEVQGLLDAADMLQIYETAELPNVILAGTEPPVSGLYKYFLFDASRGSGGKEKFPEWLKDYSKNLLIAGGLNSENVAGVIRKFKPAGVDISSGLEIIKGKKDYRLMKEFIREARNAVS